MFRVSGVKSQVVAGSVHYQVRLEALRDHWQVCGVLQLTAPEWEAFLAITRRESIEVHLNEAPLEAALANDQAR